jgi:hypothetical protein
MEIKTWADFGALSKEQLEAYSPEELEELKSSITDNEANLIKEKEEELKKIKEYGENQKIRAEKAEKKKEEFKKEKDEFSLQDIRALSDVHDDDVQDIVDFAKLKGISISEAKKNSVIKSILSDRTEERRSAEATETKGKKLSSQTSPEAILAKASKGELPEKDEDIEKYVEARIEAKLKK